MATIQHTINLTDEAQTALNIALSKINQTIDAENRRIQANKDIAAAGGTAYVGPEPSALMTFDELVQSRIDGAIRNDITATARAVAQDLADTYMKADAATKVAMMADLEKYRNPQTPTPTPPGPPQQRKRQKG